MEDPVGNPDDSCLYTGDSESIEAECSMSPEIVDVLVNGQRLERVLGRAGNNSCLIT